MELQTVFYVVGIIYMSLMLLIMIVALVAILVIKAKINAIHRQIEEKIHALGTLANIGGAVADTFHHKKK